MKYPLPYALNENTYYTDFSRGADADIEFTLKVNFPCLAQKYTVKISESEQKKIDGFFKEKQSSNDFEQFCSNSEIQELFKNSPDTAIKIITHYEVNTKPLSVQEFSFDKNDCEGINR